MIQALHHIALVADQPESASAALALVFGRPADANGWFALGNTAVLLLGRAAAGVAPLPVGETAALAGLGFSVESLDRAIALASRRGLPATPLPTLAGIGPMAALAPQAASGLHLSLVQAPGLGTAPAAEGLGLDHVVIGSHNPDRSIALFAGRLGLDMRLDRTRAEWGSRLIFFRCGDLVVEVAHRLADGVSDAPDTLSGLCWRSADVAATHARLEAAGVPVSPLKPGRKAGTRIFTIRDNAALVRTAVIGA